MLLAQCDLAECLAALAGTCRALREFLYAPRDGFLWRRIFLSTFDDPRSLGLGEHTLKDRSSELYLKSAYSVLGRQRFDWGAEYRTRIQAALFLKRHGVKEIDYRPLDDDQEGDGGEDGIPEFGADFTFAFQTIISILDTALPVSLLSESTIPAQQPWEDAALVDLSLHEETEKIYKYPRASQLLQPLSMTSPSQAFHTRLRPSPVILLL